MNESDLAWAECQHDIPSVPLDLEAIECPCDVRIFFQQPYDSHGTWVAEKEGSTFGCVNGSIYPSPASGLLEVLDVGFQGMSGALVTSRDPRLGAVGLLIRPAKRIHLKRKKVPVANASEEEEDVHELLGKLNTRLTRIDRKLEKLLKEALTEADTDALLNVVRMRRSVILPSEQIRKLINGENISLRELAGNKIK